PLASSVLLPLPDSSSASATSLCPSSFFLRLRRPPTSTLSPYTTLFRSIRGAFVVEGLGAVAGGAASASSNTVFVDAAAGIDEDGDRKSTRLNSSHVSISYAVFCLKKKTHWRSLLST